MSVTIDSLDIQIQSSAGSAVKNINELANALDRLNGGARVTKIVNSLGKLNGVLTSLQGNSRAMGQLSSLSNSLAKLGSIPKLTGLQSAVRELKKLPEVMNDLNGSDINAFATKIKALSTALEPLAKQLNEVGTAFNKLPTNIKKVVTATNSITRATKEHTNALDGQKVNLMATIYNLQAYLGAIHFVGDAIARVMSDAIEWDGIQFRFGRAFGEDAEMVLEYAEKVSRELRINKQQFMQYSSLYGSLLSGFGMAQEQVTTISVGLTELSYDIWAAYNDRYKTLEDASEAVRSAITGEIEPIRNAGIALTEASMQEYLDSIGMATTSIEKLSEAQKSEVRYAVMVNSAMQQGIVGTYASEMNTAEGTVRTFTQQLKTLGQALGSLFLPILTAVVPWLSAFVELLTEGIAALAGFFGIDFQKIQWGDPKGMKQTAAGAGATADALGSAAKSAKAMRDYTMGFDELNVISPPKDSGGGAGGADPAGGGSLGLDLDTLWDDAVFDSVSKKIDAIKEKILGWKWAFAAVSTALTALAVHKNWEKLSGAVKSVTDYFKAAKMTSVETGWLKALFPKTAMVLSEASTWVTGTFVPAMGRAFAKIPTILSTAVRLLPWAGVIAAIAGAIYLVIADYDFTEVGYKIGHALGTALKKVGEWLGTAGEWIADVGKSILKGIEAAWVWIKDEFDIKNVFDLILVMFNPVAWVTKILPKMIEIGKEVLPGLWQGVKDGWNNFWGNIEELIDGFVQGFKDALEISSPSEVFAEIGRYIVEGLTNGISEKWEALKAWFNSNIAPKFTKEFWANKWENVRKGAVEKLTEIKKSITGKVGEISTWFTENVAPKFTAEYWLTVLDGMKQGIAQKLSEVKQTATDKWGEVKEWFGANVAPKLTLKYWTSAFSGISNGLKEAVKAGVNKAIDLLNQFIDWANDALNITFDGLKNPLTGSWIIKPMSIQLATIPKIPRLADGGFVGAGQMFIAREAGPELVGSINGRSAVANNDQIVAAVSQGVYEAVVSAMNGNRGSGQNINVYLDGKQIYANVQKRESERGMQLVGNQLGYAY